jgi:glyoxylase-like metal-dependent hydrolase (beta-lactamase superfamily II)
MNVFAKAFRTLRRWLGLADPADSHLMPSHGWLNPSPADARKARKDSDARRAEARGPDFRS